VSFVRVGVVVVACSELRNLWIPDVPYITEF